MDEPMDVVKKDIVEVVNKMFTASNSKEEGQRGTYPPDTTFGFTSNDDNVCRKRKKKIKYNIC